jgi:hypothetical protein
MCGVCDGDNSACGRLVSVKVKVNTSAGEALVKGHLTEAIRKLVAGNIEPEYPISSIAFVILDGDFIDGGWNMTVWHHLHRERMLQDLFHVGSMCLQ